MVVVRGLPGVIRSPFAVGNRGFFVGGGACFKSSSANFWRFHRAHLKTRPRPRSNRSDPTRDPLTRPATPLIMWTLAARPRFTLKRPRSVESV